MPANKFRRRYKRALLRRGRWLLLLRRRLLRASFAHYSAQSLTDLRAGDPVTTWPDLGGLGRDWTQGAAGYRPRYAQRAPRASP